MRKCQRSSTSQLFWASYVAFELDDDGLHIGEYSDAACAVFLFASYEPD
jgi:hypothetical protein